MRAGYLSRDSLPALTLSDRAALFLAIAILLLTTAAVATILLTPAYGLPLGVTVAEGDSMGNDAAQVVVYADTGDISPGDTIVFEGHSEYIHHRVVSETEHGYVTQGDAEELTDQAGGDGSPPEPYATEQNIRGETVATTSLGAVQVGILALLALLGLTGAALYRRRISDTLHRARSSLPALLPRTRQLAAVLFGVLLVVSLIGPGVILLPGVEYDHSGTAAAEPSGDYVYSGDDNGDVKKLSTSDGSEVWSVNQGTGIVDEVSVHPDGGMVFSGNSDNVLRALDSSDGSVIWSSTAFGNTPASIAPHPNGSIVYAGSVDNTVRAFDADTGSEIWSSSAHSNNVLGVTVGPDGETVYTASADGSVKALDADTGAEIWSQSAEFGDDVTDVSAGPDGNQVYASVYDTDSKATALDASDGSVVWSTPFGSSLNTVSAGPNGSQVYVGGWDSAVTALDSGTGGEIWKTSAGTVNEIGSSPSGGTVYSGDESNDVREYDSDTGSSSVLAALGASVNSVAAGGESGPYGNPVSGEVTNTDGDPLDASVTLEQDGVEVASTTTNTSGDYKLEGVEDGSYTLVADADGYVTETESITVSGAPVSQNFTLGGNFGGVVEKRDGSPCSDCMVELWMVNDANTSTDAGETVKEAQQDLVDNVSRAVPRDLYQPDESVVDDVLHGGQDSEAVLLHSPQAWKEEVAGWDIPLTDYRYSVYSTGNSLEVPTNQVEAGETYIGSCWEPRDGGVGGSLENAVDDSIDPGRTTSCNITVEQIGPGNSTVNRQELETEEAFTSSAGPVTTKRHHAVELTLSEGYWRLSSTESGATTVVRAGSPEDLPRTIEHNLEEYDGTAADIALEIQQKIDDGQFNRATVGTDANGRFSHPVPDGYSTVAVTAFSGEGLLETYQSPTVADLRAEVERDDYQRSIYISQKPVTTHPPDTNVTVTVREVTNPTFEDIESYLGRLQWFNELIDTEHYTDTEGYFTDSPGSVPDGEIRDRVDQLAGIIEQQQDLLDSARDTDTNYDDTAGNVEDSSIQELKEALEAQEKALQEQTSTINNLRDTVTELQEQENGSTLLSMDIPFKTNDLDAEATAVIVQWDNGSSTTMPEQYWSVSSGSSSDLSGGVRHDYVQIEEYPLPSDVAVANIKVVTATEDGTSERSERVTNPGFSGDVPTLNAISANTLRPGPSDRVQLEIDPAERSSYQRLQSAEVYAPNGSQLTVGVSGDSVEFNTQGAGRHLVKLTVEDTDGNQYTETLRIKAGEKDAPMPPGVRIREGILGTHALAGDGVDTARVRVDQQSGTAHIGAVFPEEHSERELHVYAGDALTRTAGTYEIRALEGEDEKANGKMEVVLHTSALSEDAHLYRDGSDPITTGDGTAAGRVVHNSDGSRIQTYTGKDGTVSVEYNNSPGWGASARWWVLTNVPGATKLPGVQISPGGVLAGVTQTVGSAISGYIPDIGAVQGGFPTLHPWGEVL